MSDNPYAPPPPNPQNPYGAPPQNPYGAPPQNPYGAGPGGGFNPYAPPSQQAQFGYGHTGPDIHEHMLADRGTRLGARIIDNVLYMAAGLVGLGPGALIGTDELMFGGAGLAVLALAIFQWYLISTTGQTLAKKWMGIRIVRVDGSELGFLYGVFLRNWILQVASALIGLVGLIDALMIFGDERRCLHDHIAGTKVVIAQS
jgi:uncharacterized RDD family membrane protein YckC